MSNKITCIRRCPECGYQVFSTRKFTPGITVFDKCQKCQKRTNHSLRKLSLINRIKLMKSKFKTLKTDKNIEVKIGIDRCYSRGQVCRGAYICQKNSKNLYLNGETLKFNKGIDPENPDDYFWDNELASKDFLDFVNEVSDNNFIY